METTHKGFKVVSNGNPTHNPYVMVFNPSGYTVLSQSFYGEQYHLTAEQALQIGVEFVEKHLAWIACK